MSRLVVWSFHVELFLARLPPGWPPGRWASRLLVVVRLLRSGFPQDGLSSRDRPPAGEPDFVRPKSWSLAIRIV